MRTRRWFVGLIAVFGLCGLSGLSLCDFAARNNDVPFQFNITCAVDSPYVARRPFVGNVDVTISTFDGTTMQDVPGTVSTQTQTTGGDGVAHFYVKRTLVRSKEGDHDFVQGVRVIAEIERNGHFATDSARVIPFLWFDPRDTVKTSIYLTINTEQ